MTHNQQIGFFPLRHREAFRLLGVMILMLAIFGARTIELMGKTLRMRNYSPALLGSLMARPGRLGREFGILRIEDGAIVAGNLKSDIPHNEFLCTKKPYSDFELRLEAKLRGVGDNAGVQFRTKRLPNTTEVSGYQCDVGTAWNRSVWACLYDESRRNKLLADALQKNRWPGRKKGSESAPHCGKRGQNRALSQRQSLC